MDNKELIQLIEKKRIEKNLSIVEFCKKTNISRRTYYYILNNEIKLLKETTSKIFKELNIKIEIK